MKISFVNINVGHFANAIAYALYIIILLSSMSPAANKFVDSKRNLQHGVVLI
jgi:hypothetical protein